MSIVHLTYMYVPQSGRRGSLLVAAELHLGPLSGSAHTKTFYDLSPVLVYESTTHVLTAVSSAWSSAV